MSGNAQRVVRPRGRLRLVQEAERVSPADLVRAAVVTLGLGALTLSSFAWLFLY